MAAALDLEAVATFLQKIKLVANTKRGLVLNGGLLSLSYQGDRSTLLSIARLLIERAPPNWVVDAVRPEGLAVEYIPSSDFNALLWLEEDFEEVLHYAARNQSQRNDEELRKILGKAGEEIVVFAKSRDKNLDVVHVAEISDSFGYDVEVRSGKDLIERIEVKSALPYTNGRFFITRNEFEKAARYGNEWRLVQVTVAPSVVGKRSVTKEDVLKIRVLSSQTILKLASVDTDQFRWQISGEVLPSPEHWDEYDLNLPDDLEISLSLEDL